MVCRYRAIEASSVASALNLRRLGAGEARLGLCDVGARHLADREPVPRFAQLLLQDENVVALKFEYRGVAQHVHIVGYAGEQGVLFRVAQLLASAHDVGFRAANPVDRLIAVEDVL